MTIKLYKQHLNSDSWYFSFKGKTYHIDTGSSMIDNIAKFFKKDSLYVQLIPNYLLDLNDFGYYLIGDLFYPTNKLVTFYHLINVKWQAIGIIGIGKDELGTFKIMDIW